MASVTLVAALAAQASSLAACLCLLWRFSQLSHLTRSRLFPRQLIQLALADILFGLGALLLDLISFSALHTMHPLLVDVLCGIQEYPYRVGRLVSVFTEAHIALSFAFSIFHAVAAFRFLAESLAWLWFLGALLAFLVNVYSFGNRGIPDKCVNPSNPRTQLFDAVVILVPFSLTVLAYCVLGVGACCYPSGGNSKVASAMRRTAVYPLACAASYGLIVAYYFVPEPDDRSCTTLCAVALLAQQLNGFLNVLAYCSGSVYASWVLKNRLPGIGLRPWEDQWSSPVAAAVADTDARRADRLRKIERDVLLVLSYMEGLDLLNNGGPVLGLLPCNSLTGDGSPNELPRQSSAAAAAAAAAVLVGPWCTLEEAFGGLPRLSRAGQSSAGGTLGVLAPGPPGQGAAHVPPPGLSSFVFLNLEHSCCRRLMLAPASLEEVFMFEERLGEGSYGYVNLVAARLDYGETVGQRYALKYIRQRRTCNVNRYAYSERDIMFRVVHPGVVTLLTALQVELPEPTWVLVMEYCAGGNLQQKVRREGNPGLPVALAARYALETLEALQCLHKLQIMHRDLKPTNILLTEQDRCKIGDFGLATAEATAQTLAGSLGYVAPEVLSQSQYGPAADIYSWGAVVEFVLTGALNSFVREAVLELDASSEAVEFALDLLARATRENAEQRGTADELLGHAFLSLAERGPAVSYSLDEAHSHGGAG